MFKDIERKVVVKISIITYRCMKIVEEIRYLYGRMYY